MFIFLGTNKITGDRSYRGTAWRALDWSRCWVIIQSTTPDANPISWHTRKHIIDEREYEIHNCNERMAQALGIC